MPLKTLINASAWAIVLAALALYAGCGETDVDWIAPAFFLGVACIVGLGAWGHSSLNDDSLWWWS